MNTRLANDPMIRRDRYLHMEEERGAFKVR